MNEKCFAREHVKQSRVVPLSHRAGLPLRQYRVVRACLCWIIAHSSLVYFSSVSLGEHRASNYDSVSAYESTCANTEETFVYIQEGVIDAVIKFSRTTIFT